MPFRLVGLLLALAVWTAGGVFLGHEFGPGAVVVYTFVELAVVVYANHRWGRTARQSKSS